MDGWETLSEVNTVPFSKRERNNQSDQAFPKELAGFAMKVSLVGGLRFAKNHPKRGKKLMFV